jgi:hypothetical protein
LDPEPESAPKASRSGPGSRWWQRGRQSSLGGGELFVSHDATRFRVQGERIRATVSDASKTNAVFRVFLKIK